MSRMAAVGGLASILGPVPCCRRAARRTAGETRSREPNHVTSGGSMRGLIFLKSVILGLMLGVTAVGCGGGSGTVDAHPAPDAGDAGDGPRMGVACPAAKAGE